LPQSPENPETMNAEKPYLTPNCIYGGGIQVFSPVFIILFQCFGLNFLQIARIGREIPGFSPIPAMPDRDNTVIATIKGH
jgi:hypothetical protein